MQVMNRQPSLFDPPQKPAEPRPVNVEFMKKVMGKVLRTLEHAQFMPFHSTTLRKWERDFPNYAHKYLPPEETAVYMQRFTTELARVKAASAERAREADEDVA